MRKSLNFHQAEQVIFTAHLCAYLPSRGAGTPTDIPLKALVCRQSQTLRWKISAHFRKHWVRLFERNYIYDCPMFWLTTASGDCKHCVVFILYVLLFFFCWFVLVNKRNKQKYLYKVLVKCAHKTPANSSEKINQAA